MGKLNIQHCPETGICSIIKENGNKIDLMPFEVNQLREAVNDPQKIKAVLADVDKDFSDGLDNEEIAQLSSDVK